MSKNKFFPVLSGKTVFFQFLPDKIVLSGKKQPWYQVRNFLRRLAGNFIKPVKISPMNVKLWFFQDESRNSLIFLKFYKIPWFFQVPQNSLIFPGFPGRSTPWKPNKILNTLPPTIHDSEQTLDRHTRRTLAQLRSNHSPFLKQYLHKINPFSHLFAHFATNTRTTVSYTHLTLPTILLV